LFALQQAGFNQPLDGVEHETTGSNDLFRARLEQIIQHEA
jgi:hypothetical protein